MEECRFVQNVKPILRRRETFQTVELISRKVLAMGESRKDSANRA